MGVFLSFFPWIVFWILSGQDDYQVISLAAVVVVIFLNIKDIKSRSFLNGLRMALLIVRKRDYIVV